MLVTDVRHAFRWFIRNPALTSVTLLTLTLGIGANTAMFSVVHGVLLRALPYEQADRIVVLSGGDVDGTFGISELERLRYREQDRVLARFATYFTESANLTGDGSAERVVAARVDADVLPTLGMAPLGRVFTPEEDVRGNDRVVILAHALWQGRFGEDPGVLGQSLVVDGSARVVVGVMRANARLPTGFGGGRAEIFMPLAANSTPDPRNFHYMNGVARLRAGVSVDSARSALRAVSTQL